MGTQRVEDRHTIAAIRSFFLDFNYLSLVCSVLLAVFISSMTWVFKFQSTKRLSFRLYFWLSIADIMTHAPLLVSYRNSKVNCQIVNFIIFYANVWTVLITSVMALNLHLVFILSQPKLVRSEKFYVIGCMLLALFLCTPIAVLNGLYPESCPFYSQFESPFDVVALYGFFGLWILLPTLYCFYVFIIIAKKLSVSESSSLNSNSTEDQRNQRMLLKRMVTRLVLYPLVPVLTVIPFLVSISTQDLERNYRIFDAVLQYFAATVQGTINFLFFMFDPALPSLYLEIKRWSKPDKKSVPNSPSNTEVNDLTTKDERINFSHNNINKNSSDNSVFIISSGASLATTNEHIELIETNHNSNTNFNTLTNPRLLV